MKHSRNLVRLAITFALILIGSLNLPGAGRQIKASASAAHGPLYTSSAAAQGPNISSSLRVGQNADGRLEVFKQGSDDALWHNWQRSSGGWSGWYSLGRPSGVDILSPNVVMNADGRLVVFVGGAINDMITGTFWQIRQMPGGGWSGWDSLAGIGGNGVPIIATNADGRLELFEEGTDGAIWHNWQVAPSSSV
jgi:hypothetical protein